MMLLVFIFTRTKIMWYISVRSLAVCQELFHHFYVDFYAAL